MNSIIGWSLLVAALIVVVAVLAIRKLPRGPAIPEKLRPGRPLPDFSAVDEDGNPVHSKDLEGQVTVLVFVRGNWCPFCSKQVEKLTASYRQIVESGARLILVTPKPLATTRRVAEFFEVDFEFWLDEDLATAKSLGLLSPQGVPPDHREEFGEDTVWPTSIVVDKDSVIRFSRIARRIFDRPKVEVLLKEVRKLR